VVRVEKGSRTIGLNYQSSAFPFKLVPRKKKGVVLGSVSTPSGNEKTKRFSVTGCRDADPPISLPSWWEAYRVGPIVRPTMRNWLNPGNTK
jgi:hypothetical protein